MKEKLMEQSAPQKVSKIPEKILNRKSKCWPKPY